MAAREDDNRSFLFQFVLLLIFIIFGYYQRGRYQKDIPQQVPRPHLHKVLKKKKKVKLLKEPTIVQQPRAESQIVQHHSSCKDTPKLKLEKEPTIVQHQTSCKDPPKLNNRGPNPDPDDGGTNIKLIVRRNSSKLRASGRPSLG